jgi:hypothetical protein
MVGAPGIMAGKVGISPNGPSCKGILARPPTADEDRHPAKFDKDLRGAARHRIGSDRRAEHLDIPIGRGFWVGADDVHVIELEGRVTHLRLSSR